MCPHGRPDGNPCPHCLGIATGLNVVEVFALPPGHVPRWRPSKDEMHLEIAKVVATRSGCHRLKVGCVLANARGHVLSTGYNGRAAGLPNCAEGLGDVFPHRCPRSDAPSGSPNGCESIHAEQNALLQCRDVYVVETCYVTHSPCLVCVKLLLNTSCRRVVFVEEYPQPDALDLWSAAGRVWMQLS